MAGLLERLCGYLNGFERKPGPFFPESFGASGYGVSVALLRDANVRRYVDGSCRAAIPFEVRLRIRGVSMRERLDAADFFSGLALYVKENPMREAGDGERMAEVFPDGGCEKTAALPDGGEEYGMRFYLSRY